MLNKLIQWFNKNSCEGCDYYYPENNVCQSKKCATCGCNPYVSWFDRHFCEAYKAESEEQMTDTLTEYMQKKNDYLCSLDDGRDGYGKNKNRQ